MTPHFVSLIAACISFISLAEVAGGGNKEAIPSVKILVVGKTGSGKSTLINGLFGIEKAKVGPGLDPETKEVECFVEHYDSKQEGKFKVTICDSPGFRDSTFSDIVYTKKLQSSSNNPDLVLFVVSMEVKRWTADEAETVALVNKALGKDIWKNTLLVLTFANKVDDVELKDEFLKKFVQSLSEIGVKPDNMPVALAGHLLNGEGDHLPKHGIKYWYTELFIEGAKQVKKVGDSFDALMYLILFNKAKIKLTDETEPIFCRFYNMMATRAVVSVTIFTISVVESLSGWRVTSLVSAGAKAAQLTLDAFCSKYTRDEL